MDKIKYAKYYGCGDTKKGAVEVLLKGCRERKENVTTIKIYSPEWGDDVFKAVGILDNTDENPSETKEGQCSKERRWSRIYGSGLYAKDAIRDLLEKNTKEEIEGWESIDIHPYNSPYGPCVFAYGIKNEDRDHITKEQFYEAERLRKSIMDIPDDCDAVIMPEPSDSVYKSAINKIIKTLKPFMK